MVSRVVVFLFSVGCFVTVLVSLFILGFPFIVVGGVSFLPIILACGCVGFGILYAPRIIAVYASVTIVSVLATLYAFEIYHTFSNIENCTHNFYKPRDCFYLPPKGDDGKSSDNEFRFLTIPKYSYILRRFRDFPSNIEERENREYYPG